MHKVYIKVDEKGTEAAGTSTVVVLRGGSIEPKPYKFIVDKPFVFVIYDHENNIILFIGKVNNPNEK